MMPDKLNGRIKLIEEHLRAENAHNLEQIMFTFGEQARFDDQPWDEHHDGREEVRSYYMRLLAALPDLSIELERRHVTDEVIILEVTITGTHRGPWRGLPATGRGIRIPLCAIYTFDKAEKLAGERIYYDRAAVLGQIGLFHESSNAVGRSLTVITHPFTILRACANDAISRIRSTRTER
jgi:steroid delta-isomerase-like uncharacterized protein